MRPHGHSRRCEAEYKSGKNKFPKEVHHQSLSGAEQDTPSCAPERI
jgi:hypothetical protein